MSMLDKIYIASCFIHLANKFVIHFVESNTLYMYFQDHSFNFITEKCHTLLIKMGHRYNYLSLKKYKKTRNSKTLDKIFTIHLIFIHECP